MSEYLNIIGIAYLIQKLACAFKSFSSNLHPLLKELCCSWIAHHYGVLTKY